jgi:hypothetical protein
LGLETAFARLSTEGEAKTEEARAETARRAVDPFMTDVYIDCEYWSRSRKQKTWWDKRRRKELEAQSTRQKKKKK